MMENDAKRNTLTQRMRAARDKGVVALQYYNTLRSKHPGAIVLALEGYDDPIFYKTTIRAFNPSFSWMPLVCNGKDKVLTLRVLLERNKDADARNTFYIVDRDFDALKGHTPSANLYCTSGYSIENYLVTVDAFEELLIGEFKCSTGDDEVAELTALFKSRLSEFFDAMELANRALHYCRVKGVRAGPVESRIKQYVTISLDGISAKYDQNDLVRLVGFTEGLDISALRETAVAFDRLEPLNDWRGKYLLSFFVEILMHLLEDRCCQDPQRFSQRCKVTFNPKSSIVRVLSSMVTPPPCLKNFIASIAV